MGETVNKVNPGGAGDAAKTEEKKDKAIKVDFPIKEAVYQDAEGNVVPAYNAEGKLIAVPKPVKDETGKVIYAGFNTRKHNPLKKTDFSGLHVYLRFQAFVARVKAAILVKSAVEKEKKADNIERFGDEETRKKVARIARMQETLAELTKQLEDDGIDITGI